MNEYYIYSIAPTITMVVLKVIGVLLLDWIWVFAPLLLPVIIFFTVSIATLVFLFFAYLIKKINS